MVLCFHSLCVHDSKLRHRLLSSRIAVSRPHAAGFLPTNPAPALLHTATMSFTLSGSLANIAGPSTRAAGPSPSRRLAVRTPAARGGRSLHAGRVVAAATVPKVELMMTTKPVCMVTANTASLICQSVTRICVSACPPARLSVPSYLSVHLPSYPFNPSVRRLLACLPN